MPLDPQGLGRALGEDLRLHTTLCRREAGAFQQAVRSGDDVVVACTQERRLFGELAGQGISPLRFVNIRETGGWSRDAKSAMPKIAALLAAAKLPDPQPVPTVSYRSAGRLLVIGPLEQAERFAQLAGDALDVTIFALGGAGAQERRHPVLAGRIARLSGWLGAFELQWSQDNPIDLGLCTRCNACIAACPEDAIGLDYQVDLQTCTSHRACVKACGVAGAIDFTRAAAARSEAFDLVLDLQAQPLFGRHAPPQGYFHLPPGEHTGARALDVIVQLRELVGEFEKPKFFAYKQKLCAHSRNEKVGCTACIEICSAEAITSDKSHQQVRVEPNLCVGCGACTTVCPTGALSYAYPRATDQGTKLRTLLGAYERAGGASPVLLLHSEGSGRALVEELGRAARLGRADGVPANVIPIALWHVASVGIELWLTAIAQGAAHVAVLATGDEAPQYIAGLQEQMQVAQAILEGLGYEGSHFGLLHAANAADLDEALRPLARRRGVHPAARAKYAVAAEKRTTLDLALDHLVEHAPRHPESIALPAGAPFGTVAVDKDKCTLCLSCVGACPAGALQDNPQLPQLRFVERNCVQCGLCERTCPEQAIALQPRLLLTAERKQARVLNEAQPYACIRCGKPFGTLKTIEAMVGKLAGHPMFQGAALERVKMCGDCRVVDVYTAGDGARIGDL